MGAGDRSRSWRLGGAVSVVVAAAASLPSFAAPVRVQLSPVIVEAGSSALARLAVNDVISLSGGVGTVLLDLPLVNGVLANLTRAEVGQLTNGNYLVSSDAAVLTAMAITKGPPAPAPRQLDNVFPQVTGASTVIGNGNSGQGVGVAVIDTGIADLPDFSGRLQPGVDLSGEGNPWLDSFGHGTFVAGLIAGNGASSAGTYVGEAPGADLVPVKVAGKSGSTTVSTIIRALQWVKDNAGNIRVINMSVGAIPQGPTALNPLDQAVEVMWAAGFVVVTTAGNNGPARGTITSPGDDPLVITVGALDDKDTVPVSDDAVPSFSSNGPTSWDGWWKPDLLAPGRSVVSVMPTTSMTWASNKAARVGTRNFVGSGTSFAAAITSGAAAMVVRDNPTATASSIKAALLTTTNPGPSPPQDPFQQGHGVLNVVGAVAEPPIELLQDVSSVTVPLAGAPISLLSRQVVSTWASGGAALPAYPSAYPFPYSGPATTSLAGDGSPLFQSSAWNSSAWNGSAWTGSAWTSSAWNGSAWTSSAWNSSAWNSSAWN